MNDDGATRYSLFEATSMIAELLTQRAEQPPSSEPWEEAEEYLLAELKAGRLIAAGLPATREVSPTQQVDAIEVIPVGLWAFASFDPNQYRNGGKHLVAFHGSDADDRGSVPEGRRVKNPHSGDFYGQMTFNRHDSSSWYAISLPAARFNAWLAAFRERLMGTRVVDIPTRIEPWWNLDQVLIWISSRDIERVQRGSVSVRERPSTWAYYIMDVSDGDADPIIGTREAFEELLFAVQDESLSARVEGRRLDPAWAYGAVIHFDAPATRAYLYRSPFPPWEGAGRMSELWPQFQSDAIMKRWPAIRQTEEDVVDGDRAGQVRGTMKVQKECQRWFEELMRQHEKSPKPRKQLRAEAMAKFAIHGSAVDRAWSDALAATGSTWVKGGRPPLTLNA